MTMITVDSIPAADLRAGDLVHYAGTDYRVSEVLPVAVLSGHVVVGWSYTDGHRNERVALIYANDGALAVRIGGAE